MPATKLSSTYKNVLGKYIEKQTFASHFKFKTNFFYKNKIQCEYFSNHLKI